MIRIHTAGFICTLLIGAALTTRAQQVKQSEKDSTRQWEVGLDLLWLIDKNQVPSTSLFVRYNFENKNNQKRAWRFRLGIDNSNYDSAQIVDPRDNEIDFYSIYGAIGYEWQRELSKNATFFYGVDGRVLYSHYKVERVLYPGPNLLQGTDKTWEFGIIPFIGIKYRPLRWLAVSTESSLNFNYRIRRAESKVTDIDFPDSEGSRAKIDVNDFSVQFSPIAVINLSFYLINKR